MFAKLFIALAALVAASQAVYVAAPLAYSSPLIARPHAVAPYSYSANLVSRAAVAPVAYSAPLAYAAHAAYAAPAFAAPVHAYSAPLTAPLLYK